MYDTAMNTSKEIKLDLTKVEENLLKRKSRVAFEQEGWRVFRQEMTVSHETNSATKYNVNCMKVLVLKLVSILFQVTS